MGLNYSNTPLFSLTLSPLSFSLSPFCLLPTDMILTLVICLLIAANFKEIPSINDADRTKWCQSWEEQRSALSFASQRPHARLTKTTLWISGVVMFYQILFQLFCNIHLCHYLPVTISILFFREDNEIYLQWTDLKIVLRVLMFSQLWKYRWNNIPIMNVSR